MKTEGDFNAYLSKELRRFTPKVAVLKIADKFTTGISDFLIWANGRSLALESKFITELPTRATTKILSHPFSGAQTTFLETINLAGSISYGLIAIDSEKKFYLIYHSFIPQDGNFTRQQFEETPKAAFDYKDIEGFLTFIFDKI
jgi:hypothetical protein